MEIRIKKGGYLSSQEGKYLAYDDLVIRFSSPQEHHFLATALKDGRAMASNSFELKLDELRIIERLRKLEKAG
jgi:hypothetical protein